MNRGRESDRVGFIMRHWRGGLSLPVSFWVNNVLFDALLSGGVGVLMVWISLRGAQLRASSIAMLCVWPAMLAFSVWATVGAWRSATAHPEQGGRRGWAVLAKTVLVLGAVTSAASTVSDFLPQLPTYLKLAAGRDPLGRLDIRVERNGRLITLSGPFGMGAADQFANALTASPGARMVLLESPGGRVVEAAQIADLVKKKGLATRVAVECSSACTLVFLNGARRDLAPGAQLGFHRVATGASNAWVDDVANAAMAPVYLSAGLPQLFVDRINSTDSRSIWYPTRDELISAGVIRQAFAGLELDLTSIREKSAEEFQDLLLANPLWMAVEQRFPASISAAAAGMLLASQSGLGDEAVVGEAMKVIGSLVGKVLRTASSETLERFTVLHAREIGTRPERQMLACSPSTALGVLGPSGAKWLLDALQEPERDGQTRLPSAAELEVIHRELGDVSLPAVGKSFYESSPSSHARASCVRLSRMIERISSLPTRQRRLAARLMLQA